MYAQSNAAKYFPLLLVGTLAVLPSGKPYPVRTKKETPFSHGCRNRNSQKIENSHLSKK